MGTHRRAGPLSAPLLSLVVALVTAAAVVAPGVRGDAPLDLHLVSHPAAKCLDGSSPGYYLRTSKSNSWKIHLRGGGWCFTPGSCLHRASTQLGTSKVLPPQIPSTVDDDLPTGFMSDNATVNPVFSEWNTVFVEYCDGSSFMGARSEPLVVKGTALYFSGFANLNAVLDELVAKHGMRDADVVVLTGTSAGGLATYIHASTVATKLSTARVLAMPDAGFFLDHPTVAGDQLFRGEFQGAVGPGLWNASAGMNPDCVAAYGDSDDLWHCAFAQYNVPYITPDLLVVNSLYDSAQLRLVLNLSCASNLTECNTTEMAAVDKYRDAMLAALQPVLQRQAASTFLTACNQHEETCADEDWHGITINGTAMNEAALAWYNRKFHDFVDGTWPNNPSCAPYGARHGGC